MRLPLLAAAALAVAACGPGDAVDVEVELRPDGSMRRTLTVQGARDQEPPPAELLAAPRAIYKTERTEKANVVAFEGTFAATPRDLALGGDGNRGGSTVVNAPFGSFHLYRESLPGRTDYVAQVEQLRTTADEMVRFAIELARTELADEPGLDRLLARLDGPVRRDLEDLFVLGHRCTADQPFWFLSPEGWVQAIDFLEERGYLVPEATRGRLPGDLDVDAITDGLVREIAATMARPDDEKLLAKLRSYDAHRFGVASARAKAALGRGDDESGSGDAEKPKPRAGVTFRLRFGDRRPSETNGTWDEQENAVVWHAVLDATRIGRPTFFASWLTPNEAWQRRHLGAVTLGGPNLRALLSYDAGLEPDRRVEWRRRLEALRPDDAASIATIRAFDEAAEGPRLVLAALERAKEKR